MKTFIAWFLVNFSDFLLTPPISVFTAFAILFVVSRFFDRMIHI